MLPKFVRPFIPQTTVTEREKGNGSEYYNTWEDDTKVPEWSRPVADTAEGEGDLDSKR